MALQITKTFSTGVTANYWVLDEFTFCKSTQCLSVNMLLYVDKANKQSGSQPIGTFTFNIFNVNAADMDAIWVGGSGATMAGIYTYLQTRPEFTGSLSV